MPNLDEFSQMTPAEKQEVRDRAIAERDEAIADAGMTPLSKGGQ
jgi:hypothetical protein